MIRMSETIDSSCSDVGGAGPSKPSRWLVWLFGAAACVALVFVVTHLSEEKEFLRLLEKSEPYWLFLALVLQAGTYLTQGIGWRVVVQFNGHRLGMLRASELSLAMLFVNQTLPSGGISGEAMISNAFVRAGMSQSVVWSVTLVNFAMYYLAYALCMMVALVLALYHGYFGFWVNVTILIFALVALGVAWFVTVLPVSKMLWLKSKLRLHRKIACLLDSMIRSHVGSVRDMGVYRKVFACHVMTFMLDAATFWVVVRALGVVAPIEGIFVSLMISTMFRTIAIMPGGLGTFEAAAVMSLKSIGLPLMVGLSATMLFRGLTFWLPMLPGFIASRHFFGKKSDALAAAG